MRLRVPSSCYADLQDFVKECRNDDDGDNTNNCEWGEWWLTIWIDREKYKETLAAGEGDEARMVVQFILDAVREIEERASAIGRETTKSKNLSRKKNMKNTNKKG